MFRYFPGGYEKYPQKNIFSFRMEESASREVRITRGNVHSSKYLLKKGMKSLNLWPRIRKDVRKWYIYEDI